MSKFRLGKAGFTLLEILVVLMIMGFLLAMITPRLVGVFQDSEDTLCDSNIKRNKEYVQYFELTYNKLPDKMINPVNHGATIGWAGPAEENLTQDGSETFTTAILERLTLGKHILNQAEADELKGMGINQVVCWNSDGDAGKTDIFGGAIDSINDPYDSTADLGRHFEVVNVAEDVMVVMIGGGAADSTADVVNSVYIPGETYPHTLAVGDQIADPEWMYRIVLGIGPDCELLTKKMAASYGTCPSYERAASNETSWGYYCLVVPRLEATCDRLGAAALTSIDVEQAVGGESESNPQVRTVAINEPTASSGGSFGHDPYPRAEFDIFCPEGHRYPEVVEKWEIIK